MQVSENLQTAVTFLKENLWDGPRKFITGFAVSAFTIFVAAIAVTDKLLKFFDNMSMTAKLNSLQVAAYNDGIASTYQALSGLEIQPENPLPGYDGSNFDVGTFHDNACAGQNYVLQQWCGGEEKNPECYDPALNLLQGCGEQAMQYMLDMNHGPYQHSIANGLAFILLGLAGMSVCTYYLAEHYKNNNSYVPQQDIQDAEAGNGKTGPSASSGLS